jgi:predicted site-specific integrase-resolvase
MDPAIALVKATLIHPEVARWVLLHKDRLVAFGFDLPLHAKTERVPRRIDVDLESAVFFLNWIAK